MEQTTVIRLDAQKVLAAVEGTTKILEDLDLVLAIVAAGIKVNRRELLQARAALAQHAEVFRGYLQAFRGSDSPGGGLQP